MASIPNEQGDLHSSQEVEMVQLGHEDASDRPPLDSEAEVNNRLKIHSDVSQAKQDPIDKDSGSALTNGDALPPTHPAGGNGINMATILYFIGTVIALSTGLCNATQSSSVSRFGTLIGSSHFSVAFSFLLCSVAMAVIRFFEGMISSNPDEKEELKYLKELYHKAFLPMKDEYMKRSELESVNTVDDRETPVIPVQNEPEAFPTNVESLELDALEPETPPVFSSILKTEVNESSSSGMVSPAVSAPPTLSNPLIDGIVVPFTNSKYDPSIFAKKQKVGYYEFQVGPDEEPKQLNGLIWLALIRFLHLRRDPNDPYRWWYLFSPAIGFCFVLSMVMITPELGVGVVFVVLLVGKLCTSLTVDHFGVMKMPKRAFSVFSALALVLAIAGSALYVVPGVVDDPPNISTGLIVGLIVIILCIGIIYPFNAVIMNRAKYSYPSPIAGTFVAFSGGFLMSLIACIIHASLRPSILSNLRDNLDKSEWWMWIGGLGGCYTVLSSVIFVPVLGASYLMCLMIVGELMTSTFYDHYDVWSLGKREITGYRIGGLVLCVVAVVVFGSLKSINDCMSKRKNSSKVVHLDDE